MSDAGLTADLTLDIRQALAGIDRVNEALHRATTAVRVTADARAVTTAVQAAIDAADVGVQVTAEAAQVTGSIDAAVENANTAVEVTGEAAPVTGAIDAAVDAADTHVTVDADTTQAVAQVKRLDDATERLEGSAGRATEGFGRLGAVIAAISLAAAVHGVLGLVDAASDLAESSSKAAVVFGDSFEDIQQFANDAAGAVGLSAQEALEATATFGNLFQALGSTRDEAAAMSPQVVQLAADLASFNNTGVDEALERLRSGLVGEVEPLRRMGISFNAVQVEARAVELGLADVNGVVSEGAKVQARLSLIMEQSTLAQGDFARTATGAANQQRILQSEVKNLAAAAGEQLLPVFLDLIQQARGELLPRLAELGDRVLPAVGAAFRAAGPLAGSFLDLMIGLAPVLNVLASVVESIPAPLLQVVATFFALSRALGGIPALVSKVSTGLKAIGATNPLILAATAALTILATVTGHAAAEQRTLADEARGVAQALSLQGATFDQALGQALSSGGEFADVLALIGASGQTVADVAGDGSISLDELNRTFAEAARNGFVVSGSVDELIDQFNRLGPVAEEAAREYLFQRLALGELTEGQLLAATGARTLDRAMEDPLAAVRALAGGTVELTSGMQGLAAALAGSDPAAAELSGGLQRVFLEATAVRRALAGLAGGGDAALGLLISEFATGAVSIDELAGVAAELGVDLDGLTEIVEATAAAFGQFSEDVLDTFPSALDVAGAAIVELEDGSEAFSLQAFRDELARTVAAAQAFPFNIQFLIDHGLAQLAEVAAQRGPEFTQSLVDAINNGEGDVAAEIESLLGVYEGAVGPGGDLDTFLRNSAAPAIAAATGKVGRDSAARMGLEFAPVVPAARGIMDAARQAVADAGAPVEGAARSTGARGTSGFRDGVSGMPGEAATATANSEAAIRNGAAGIASASNSAGVGIGHAFGDGIARGIDEKVSHIVQQARLAAEAAENEIRRVSGISSPSRVFAELGAQLAAGLALGLSDASALAGIRTAAETAALVAQQAVVPAVGLGGGGSSSTTSVAVDVTVDLRGATGITDAQASRAGALAGAAMADALARRQIVVNARTQ